MEETCTCGAALPANAQFCPMCGRPVRDLGTGAEGRSAEEEHAGELGQAPPPPPIGFGNPDALRASYVGALAAALLANIPFLHLLCFVWYPAAGFLAVYLYRRRSGQSPSTRAGAKLGWITGVFTFAISLLLSALVSLIPSGGVGLGEQLRRSIEETPMQDEARRQVLEFFDNPAILGALVVFALLTSFVVTVGFTTAGGALGARVLEED